LAVPFGATTAGVRRSFFARSPLTASYMATFVIA